MFEESLIHVFKLLMRRRGGAILSKNVVSDAVTGTVTKKRERSFFFFFHFCPAKRLALTSNTVSMSDVGVHVSSH